MCGEKKCVLKHHFILLELGGRMIRSVLLFLDSSCVGGIESHVLILAKLLNQHCQVKVILWRHYQVEHPLLKQLATKGIAFDVLNGSIFKLARIWQASPQAVLHCHGYKANLIGRLLATIFRRCCVCTFHNGDRGEGIVRLYTWLDELSSRLSRNIAVSREIALRLKNRCQVMSNMVDMPAINSLSGNIVGPVAFVGRFEVVKRPDRFFALAKKFPKQQFAMWGHGSQMQQFVLEPATNICLHGAVSSMEYYWPSIDILIICSEQEGFPMVALEAMSAGVPVLTLPLGELPMLIQHDVNGFIAKNEAELQQCLEVWFNMNDDQRLNIRQNARETIKQHYSAEQLWPLLEKVYS